MQDNNGLGNNRACAVITDRETETVCDARASEEILVSSAFGLFAVPICDEHSRQHRRFYNSRKKRRRVDTSADSSRQRVRRPGR